MMMYQTVQSFIDDYGKETELTLKLLDALTDESLGQEVARGYRTLGHLAWHLIPSGGILQPTGLKYEAPAEGGEPPASAAAIAQAYRQAVHSLLEEVQTQWNDEKLHETSTLWGEQLKNGFVLYLVLKHEIHHRGQLTILMRQAGVPLVGIYGPTKEEWISMGTEAPV